MTGKGRRNKNIPSRKIKWRKEKSRSTAEKKAHSKISQGEEKPKKSKSVSYKTISDRRLLAFRLIAITIIPVLFFLLLEGILRIAHYGFPSNIIIKTKENGQDYYCSNPKFSWRFFPPKIARTVKPFTFPAKKGENSYRIFVLGASAAAGTPDSAFSFGRILQVMLKQQFPQTNFEVITTAMPAINSHAVLEIAKDCSKHDADLFIVYLGNNEVVGPYGAGTVFSPLSSSISLIRFGIKFKATRTGQLFSNLLSSTGSKNTPEIWKGLAMFLEKQVRADDEKLKVVYRYFQRNLEDICHIASKQNIPVILSTVTSNLKNSPPFASLHRTNISESEKESWDNLYQAGIKYETEGNYSSAVEQYLKADEIDSIYADLQFRLGQCFYALSEYQKSKQRYIQARELDTLRFRADNKINEIIRNVASSKINKSVYLVDAMKTFEEKSPHNITGAELFHEHVHMTFSGNYLLAKTINEKVQEILPERIKNNRENIPQLPSEAECARYLAYTDWEKNSINEKLLNEYFKQPPFTNQLNNEARISNLKKEIENSKNSLTPEALTQIDTEYKWAILKNSSDWVLFWKYGVFLDEQNNYGEAVRQYREVLNFVPNHYDAFAKIASVCGLMGDIDSAIKNNLEALRIYPLLPDAYYNLALSYQFKNDMEKAIKNYSKAIEVEPDCAPAYKNLGLVLYQLKKVDQAIKTFRKGLKYMPDDWDLNFHFGLILASEGQKNEAIKMFKNALQIDPNNQKALQALEAIEIQQ